jgi:hypothetical protein
LAVLVLLPTVLYVLCCLPANLCDATASSKELAAQEERQVKLDLDRQVFQGTPARRAKVLDDMVEGQCSLLEAAACFRDLNQSTPHFPWEHFRRTFPGATDEERHCRQVIELLRWRLEVCPDDRTPAIRRLETELEEHLRRGPLHLPENS